MSTEHTRWCLYAEYHRNTCTTYYLKTTTSKQKQPMRIALRTLPGIMPPDSSVFLPVKARIMRRFRRPEATLSEKCPGINCMIIKLLLCSISMVFNQCTCTSFLRATALNKPVPWDYVKEIHASLNNAWRRLPDECIGWRDKAASGH